MISVIGLALPILLALVASVGIGIVMIVGALKMMRLESYGWAMTASILALLPCSPVGLLGLVMGIWSLVVLNRRDVKEAFQAGRQGRLPATSPRARSASMGKRGVLPWLIVAVTFLFF